MLPPQLGGVGYMAEFHAFLRLNNNSQYLFCLHLGGKYVTAAKL